MAQLCGVTPVDRNTTLVLQDFYFDIEESYFARILGSISEFIEIKGSAFLLVRLIYSPSYFDSEGVIILCHINNV